MDDKKLLDALRSDFHAKMGDSLQSIEVPELAPYLNGEVPRIYYKGIMTMKHENEILALREAGKYDEALCTLIVLRALDENGKKIFRKPHIQILRNMVDPKILTRLAEALSPQEEDPEELEKSLEQTEIYALPSS